MKALTDAQRRALRALPLNGPYGAEGYGWAREWGEVTQRAGPHVPFRTIAILVERGFAELDRTSVGLVRITPAGREQRLELMITGK